MSTDSTASRLVSSVGFVRARDHEVRSGLIGYVTCLFAGTLLLDGITLRVKADGVPTLSFPERRDARGRRHPLFRPVDDPARRAFEQAIFDALGIDTEGTL